MDNWTACGLAFILTGPLDLSICTINPVNVFYKPRLHPRDSGIILARARLAIICREKLHEILAGSKDIFESKKLRISKFSLFSHRGLSANLLRADQDSFRDPSVALASQDRDATETARSHLLGNIRLSRCDPGVSLSLSLVSPSSLTRGTRGILRGATGCGNVRGCNDTFLGTSI